MASSMLKCQPLPPYLAIASSRRPVPDMTTLQIEARYSKLLQQAVDKRDAQEGSWKDQIWDMARDPEMKSVSTSMYIQA